MFNISEDEEGALGAVISTRSAQVLVDYSPESTYNARMSFQECPWGGISEPKRDFRIIDDPLVIVQEQGDGVTSMGEIRDIILVSVKPGIDHYTEAVKDCLSCPFRPSTKDTYVEGIGCSGVPSFDMDTAFLDSVGTELPVVTIATIYFVDYSGIQGDFGEQPLDNARRYATGHANCLRRLAERSDIYNGPAQLKGNPSLN